MVTTIKSFKKSIHVLTCRVEGEESRAKPRIVRGGIGVSISRVYIRHRHLKYGSGQRGVFRNGNGRSQWQIGNYWRCVNPCVIIEIDLQKPTENCEFKHEKKNQQHINSWIFQSCCIFFQILGHCLLQKLRRLRINIKLVVMYKF